MAYIHSKGIAHLDLKTTNILLTSDKRSTVVADFGISRTRNGGDVGSNGNPLFDHGSGVQMEHIGPIANGSGGGAALALTPQYCAPERLINADLDFDQLLATDVYAYGKTYFLALSWAVSQEGGLLF